MYGALVTFLEAVVSPHDFPDLASSERNWNWDRDTKVKAQGLKAALCFFQTLAVFMTTKNILDEVKLLATKLQKRDQDIFNAYRMVDEVQSIKNVRRSIDVTFSSWYDEIAQLAENVGVPESVPRKTNLDLFLISLCQ